MKKSRIWELDFFRGFAIVMVVIDHAMYDLAYICSSWKRCGVPFLEKLHSVGVSYMHGDLRFFWRPAFLFLFFCISGICTAFSSGNLKRGLRLFTVSALVSVVTYAAQEITGEQCFILLGVLHCLALITLSYAACDALIRLLFKAIEKKKPLGAAKTYIRAALFLLLAVGFFFINRRYNVPLTTVFRGGNTIASDGDILGLFFFERSWWTADYFPLFPYIAFFFLGAALAEILYARRRTSLFPNLDGPWHYVFSFPGRFSLWIYLAGQVVAIGLCYLLTAIFL